MVRSLDQNATQKIGEMSPTGYTHGEVGLDLGFCYFNPAVVMRSSAVVKCLDQLFSLCGMTSYIHSVLGRSPNSREVKGYLIKRGAASTHSTRYHPIGYSQVERHNGILWKAIRLALKSHNSPVDSWEAVLPDALHAIRSLLCVCVCAFVRVQMLPGTNCFLVLVGGL